MVWVSVLRVGATGRGSCGGRAEPSACLRRFFFEEERHCLTQLREISEIENSALGLPTLSWAMAPKMGSNGSTNM